MTPWTLTKELTFDFQKPDSKIATKPKSRTLRLKQMDAPAINAVKENVIDSKRNSLINETGDTKPTAVTTADDNTTLTEAPPTTVTEQTAPSIQHSERGNQDNGESAQSADITSCSPIEKQGDNLNDDDKKHDQAESNNGSASLLKIETRIAADAAVDSSAHVDNDIKTSSGVEKHHDASTQTKPLAMEMTEVATHSTALKHDIKNSSFVETRDAVVSETGLDKTNAKDAEPLEARQVAPPNSNRHTTGFSDHVIVLATIIALTGSLISGILKLLEIIKL